MSHPSRVIGDLLAGRLRTADVAPDDLPVLILKAVAFRSALDALIANLQAREAMVEPATVPKLEKPAAELLTVKEAAALARIGKNTAYKLTQDGGAWAPFTKRIGRTGRGIRIERAGLEAWMRSGK